MPNKVTIANGANTSEAIDIAGRTLVGLIMPSAFTGTAISFTAWREATQTYVPVEADDGNVISITVAVDVHIVISPLKLAGVSKFKLVSNQTELGDRVIELVTRLK